MLFVFRAFSSEQKACVRVCTLSLFGNLILDIEELSGNSSMESKYREHRTTNSILSNVNFNEILNNPSVGTSAWVAQTDEVCLYAPPLELSILACSWESPKITWPKVALPGGEQVQGMTLPGIEGLVGLERV